MIRTILHWLELLQFRDGNVEMSSPPHEEWDGDSQGGDEGEADGGQES